MPQTTQSRRAARSGPSHAVPGRLAAAFFLGLGLVALAPKNACPDVMNYDFRRDDTSHVAWTGTTCSNHECFSSDVRPYYYSNTYGTTYCSGEITFTDATPVGVGTVNSVTLYAGTSYRDGAPAPAFTVNGVSVGSFSPALPDATCCYVEYGANPLVGSLDITSAYGAVGTAKTIDVSGSSNYWTLWTLTLTDDNSQPMFRVAVDYTPVFSPTFTAPADAALLNTTMPSISWTTVGTATQYRLQIDDKPLFYGTPIFDQVVTGTTYAIPPGLALTGGVTYYARCRAEDGPGGPGVWSSIIDFTIVTAPPPAPVLVAPPADATIPTQTPTFNWQPVTSPQ